MNDYNFGNFISMLRVGRGLSQYQLGALVGVTDKAVSKWENGNAKPRLQTCNRLAEVLGVNINDLLSCQFANEPQARKKGDIFLKTEIINKAQERLRQIYGTNPPIEFWSRLESELTVLKNTDMLIVFDYLGELQLQAQISEEVITVRASVPSSLTAWLLGATAVNPLVPHYYCPRCRKVQLFNDVEDGFDLPAAVCNCGCSLERDGHNIPFEGYAQSLETSNSIDLNISATFYQSAVNLLMKYYKGIAQILPVMIEEPDALGHDSYFVKYVILPNDVSMPVLNEDGCLNASNLTYYQQYKKYISYYFGAFPTETKLSELTKKYRKPFANELLEKEVIQDAFDYRCGEIPHIADSVSKSDTINFSLLTRLDGLNLSSGAWENNGEELVRTGKTHIRELVAYREDVWDIIIRNISPQTLSGSGLPLKIMNDVRLGRYQRMGLPEEIRLLFRQIGTPDWYGDHVSKISYLFPKSHCISYLIRDLMLAWYHVRYPEEFNR